MYSVAAKACASSGIYASNIYHKVRHIVIVVLRDHDLDVGGEA